MEKTTEQALLVQIRQIIGTNLPLESTYKNNGRELDGLDKLSLGRESVRHWFGRYFRS